ncbi:hypothetical protein [Ottowia thiooxydans]|uniref:Lipoprotein n=1 Tax=Ottowia thiooxydans TaxID=219182 RepID=A0ABV2Q7R9_9BURK
MPRGPLSIFRDEGALFKRSLGSFAVILCAASLTACASLRDASRLSYVCPNDLRFEARLYQDMAILEGWRGHAVLARIAGQEGPETSPAYADETVRANFGLGMDGRLARLDYTSIPEPMYCQRVLAPGDNAPAKAAEREGPKAPPPPPDPNAPIQTNIIIGPGPIDGG